MDLKGASDGTLITAIQQKNLEALEEFYDRHHRLALAVAYKILNDRGQSEDVVQEAFLAVWRQAGAYRSELGAANGWLFSIVRHRAIDVTRRRANRQLILPLNEAVLKQSDFDVFGHVSAELDRQEVRAAVNTLPADQRDAIIMAFFGGYTYGEVAQRMGTPLATVKSRIRLGMQKLRSMLVQTRQGGTSG